MKKDNIAMDEVDFVKDQLPDGAYAIIASIKGLSISYVSKMFTGQRRMQADVLEAALEYIEAERALINSLTIKYQA